MQSRILKVSRQLVTTCRRGGAVCGSITCIQKRVIEFKTLAEATVLSDVDCLTLQHLVQKLEWSNASFKEFDFGVLDLIDKAERDHEQAVLEEHDNKVADTTACIQQLLSKTLSPSRQIQI